MAGRKVNKLLESLYDNRSLEKEDEGRVCERFGRGCRWCSVRYRRRCWSVSWEHNILSGIALDSATVPTPEVFTGNLVHTGKTLKMFRVRT